MSHFTPELFRFLKQLKRNNDRGWFEANKGRYVEHVRDPILRFIEDFAAPLEKISPHFVADARTNGGSMFRIYRDTRFAKDKSPYKTHAAAHFRHEAAKDVHAPGFYLHLEPGRVMGGAGIWRPDGAALKQVRDALVARDKEWKRIRSSKPYRDGQFEMSGETLKRSPRGYDPEHPLVEDLKRKDFAVLAMFNEDDACGPGFLKKYEAFCKSTAPTVRFLTEACGVPF